MSQPESGEGAKPRILVAGASEILGRCIVAEFQQANWEVLGYGHSLAHPAKAASTTTQSFQFNVDFSDEKVARETIKQFKPCVIVHVPYERKLGEIDTDLTTALNVKATKFIAQEAVKIGAWVIYISSDWVYDGTTPPYRESDEPGPMNTYGQIKVDGENTLINVTRDSCILRVPLLYGCIESLEDSEITALMLLVLDVSNKHKLSHHEKYYAASAMDVARIVRRLCDKRLQDTCLRGIFHWSGHEELTLYNMATRMARMFSLPFCHIEPDSHPSTETQRPFNTWLDSSKLNEKGVTQCSSFNEGTYKCLLPLMKGTNIAFSKTES